MEWMNMAWAWIETNIAPLLTAANIALVLNVIITLFRQKRTLNDNTYVTKDLRKALNESRAQSKQITELEARVAELTDASANAAIKSDAILDILYSVYMGQTALSQATRDKIDTLHTNARFATSKARAAILKELEEMKAKEAEAAAERLKKTDKIKKLVGAETETKSLVNFEGLK